MDVLVAVEQAALWVSHNTLPLLIGLGLALMRLLMLRRRIDRAERVFRRAGLRVPTLTVRQLRDEFARAAVDVERQRVLAENKTQLETGAIESEKARILSLVRSTPAVVKEVGEALRAIEHEYEQGLRSVKSDQAREGLRRTAEKQIQDVLRTVSDDAGRLPQFHLAEHREHDLLPKRSQSDHETLNA